MKKETITLTVGTRLMTENPKILRKAGDVPGVIYGGKMQNLPIKCKLKEFHTVYVRAGENTLVDITVDGKKIPCLIHAVSFEPVSGTEEHVDFYAVDMTKKVTTHVPVIVIGISPAVKSQGGVLVTVHDEVEVTCLPQDIPTEFTVDIGVLQNFRDSITVADLPVSEAVTIKSAPETVLITVQEPRKEEVVEPVAGAAEATAEGTPGAAPAAGAKPDEKAAKAPDAAKDKAAKK